MTDRPHCGTPDCLPCAVRLLLAEARKMPHSTDEPGVPVLTIMVAGVYAMRHLLDFPDDEIKGLVDYALEGPAVQPLIDAPTTGRPN